MQKGAPFTARLLQRPQLDVLKPARAAVILQANVAFARVILVSNVELMRCAVGPPVRLGEFREVDRIHLFTVQHDLDARVAAGDLDVIPFPDGPHRIPRRLCEIVKRTSISETRTRRVINGDLETVETDIL